MPDVPSSALRPISVAKAKAQSPPAFGAIAAVGGLSMSPDAVYNATGTATAGSPQKDRNSFSSPTPAHNDHDVRRQLQVDAEYSAEGSSLGSPQQSQPVPYLSIPSYNNSTMSTGSPALAPNPSSPARHASISSTGTTPLVYVPPTFTAPTNFTPSRSPYSGAPPTYMPYGVAANHSPKASDENLPPPPAYGDAAPPAYDGPPPAYDAAPPVAPTVSEGAPPAYDVAPPAYDAGAKDEDSIPDHARDDERHYPSGKSGGDDPTGSSISSTGTGGGGGSSKVDG
jgi:hypothetical protein